VGRVGALNRSSDLLDELVEALEGAADVVRLAESEPAPRVRHGQRRQSCQTDVRLRDTIEGDHRGPRTPEAPGGSTATLATC